MFPALLQLQVFHSLKITPLTIIFDYDYHRIDMKNRSAQRGFTLIELLVVIGILAILLSIVVIAINPARQFGQANDTKRQSAVTQILNAVGAYYADNGGILPVGIPVGSASAALAEENLATYQISDTGVNICADILGTYIPSLPVDPSLGVPDVTDCSGAYATGYTIVQDAAGRVSVAAPFADITTPIVVTR
jgi:prepilin-type N-terminal cleavage/methylation domain-containing protein